MIQKKLTVILLLLMLMPAILADDESIKHWWQSSTTTVESFPFSLAVGTPQLNNENFNQGTIIAVDFISKQSCSNAELRVFVDDPNGRLIEGVSPKVVNNPPWNSDHGSIRAGQSISGGYRFYPPNFVAGTWVVRSFLYCNDNRQHIQEGSDDRTTFLMVQKSSGSCSEGFVGVKFCTDDYRYIHQPFRNCPNGPSNSVSIVSNKLVQDCGSQSRCDPSGPVCTVSCSRQSLNRFCKGSELWENYKAADCSEQQNRLEVCSSGCDVDRCAGTAGGGGGNVGGLSDTQTWLLAILVFAAVGYFLFFRRKK